MFINFQNTCISVIGCIIVVQISTVCLDQCYVVILIFRRYIIVHAVDHRRLQTNGYYWQVESAHQWKLHTIGSCSPVNSAHQCGYSPVDAAHQWTLLTSGDCWPGEIADQRRLLTTEDCWPVEIADQRRLLTSRHCLPVETAHQRRLLTSGYCWPVVTTDQ